MIPAAKTRDHCHPRREKGQGLITTSAVRSPVPREIFERELNAQDCHYHDDLFCER